MSWEQIISPTSIAGLLTMIGAVTAAMVALSGIKKYKEQKAYDLFTAKRLQNYDFILKTYQKIMSLSSIEYIDANTNVSSDNYFTELAATMAKLNGTLSSTEKQDYYLLFEFENLERLIKEYINDKSEDSVKALNEQRTLVKCFSDIYLWALWRYYQRLHSKKNDKFYHGFYEEQFVKVYNRSKALNEQKTTFFKKYAIEDLIDAKNN